LIYAREQRARKRSGEVSVSGFRRPLPLDETTVLLDSLPVGKYHHWVILGIGEQDLQQSLINKIQGPRLSLSVFDRARNSRLFQNSATLPIVGDCLVVQNHFQEGRIDVESTVVPDEPLFPKFIHEKIDPRTGCPDHFRQGLL